MDVKLSREADQMICTFYKAYLERRKSGVSRDQAKCFPDFNEWHESLFPGMSKEDALSTCAELAIAFDFRRYVTGGFMLSNDAIIYMENRFKNGLQDVMSFLAHFIPLVP